MSGHGSAPGDFTGRRIGRLTAVRSLGTLQYHGYIWEWRCDCGRRRDANPARLALAARQAKHPLSCGRCNIRPGKKPVNLTGRRFGRWLVLERVGQANCCRHSTWLCRCDCGAEVVVRSTHLTHHASACCRACGDRLALERSSEAMKLHRYRARLSIRAAAARIGVTYQRWHQMETQEPIPARVWDRMMAALGFGPRAKPVRRIRLPAGAFLV